jgi:hypothetical protein
MYGETGFVFFFFDGNDYNELIQECRPYRDRFCFLLGKWCEKGVKTWSHTQ